MESGRDAQPSTDRFASRFADAVPAALKRTDPAVVGVVAVVVLALALRLVVLGYRPAHWDEGRVAYWALRYQETGAFAYRHIIHGPFVQHVTSVLFGLVGPSDFVARLPVAVVGGLFPLSALLFREHLREEETVILALFLATNSVLLYYSRFMRSDVLVAAFMFTALGFLVRFYDTRRARHLYGAAAFLAFGIASKENAILYLLTWIGATALVVDTTLYRPRTGGSGLSLLIGKLRGAVADVPKTRPALTPVGVRRQVAARTRSLPESVRDPARQATAAGSWSLRKTWALLLAVGRSYLPHVVGAAALLVGLSLFFFAARGAAVDVHPVAQWQVGTVGFWEGVTNPTQFPEMVRTTFGYWQTEYLTWFQTAGGGEDGLLAKYEEFAPQYFDVLIQYAAPITVFSVIGFVRERYGAADSRNLVMFFGYAGFVSALAYPLGLDIFGPWNVSHAIVPLAVPAAVGLAVIYRWGRDALAERDVVTLSLALVVLLVVVGQVAVTSYGAVYQHPQSDENKLVQYGQPADDMRSTLDRMDATVAGNDGTDVLVFGSSFVKNGTSDTYLPGCLGTSGWFDSLPLPWYLNAADAQVTCGTDVDELGETLESPPPVIIANADDLAPIREAVSGYDVVVHEIRTSGTETAFLFDRDALSE